VYSTLSTRPPLRLWVFSKHFRHKVRPKEYSTRPWTHYYRSCCVYNCVCVCVRAGSSKFHFTTQTHKTSQRLVWIVCWSNGWFNGFQIECSIFLSWNHTRMNSSNRCWATYTTPKENSVHKVPFFDWELLQGFMIVKWTLFGEVNVRLISNNELFSTSMTMSQHTNQVSHCSWKQTNISISISFRILLAHWLRYARAYQKVQIVRLLFLIYEHIYLLIPSQYNRLQRHHLLFTTQTSRNKWKIKY
jgi:hypothetical protein